MSGELAAAIDARRGQEDFDTSWGYNSLVSVKHRYVCMAVPKVACTTVKRTLREFEGLTPIDDHGELHESQDQDRLAWFDTQEAVSALTSKDWLRFAFVRNPYDRMFSAWKSKIAKDQDRQYASLRTEIREAYGYPTPDTGPPPTVAFGDFVGYLAESEDPHVTLDGHWNSQTGVLLYDLVSYDVLGRFETFVEDFTKILKVLGASEQVLAIASEVTNATARVPLAAAYNRELASLVSQMHNSDFEAFGYDRDSWLFL